MTQPPTIQETTNGSITITEIGTDDDYQVTFNLDKLSEGIDDATYRLRELSDSLTLAARQIDTMVANYVLTQWVDKVTGK